MLTMAITGVVFVGLAYLEKKNKINAENVKTITNVGMITGITIFLLIFIYKLHVFL